MKSRLINSLFVILGGCLTGLAFYSDYLSLLVWISIIPYFFVVYSISDKKSFFSYTFLYTFTFYLIHFYWLKVVSTWVGVIAYVGWLGVILYLSLIFLLLSSLIHFLRSDSLGRILGIPAVWVIIEWLNSKGMFAITSSSLAYTQKAEWGVSQLASYGGIYLISFIIVLVNVILLEVLIRFTSKEPNKGPYKLALGIVVIFVVAILLVNSTSKPNLKNAIEIKARIIQPNIPQKMKMNFNYIGAIQSKLNNSTLGAISDGIDLYILPESLIPGLFKHHRRFYNKLATFIPDGSIFMFGSNRKESGKYYNSLYVVDNSFKHKYRYDKIRLVPFGEYIPFRKIVDNILPKKYALFNLDLFPGKEGDVSEITMNAKAGLSICFESVFSDIYYEQHKKGADYFVVITNDAWYLESNGLRLHQNITAFRAVESGKPMLFCANTGISSYIDRTGTVIDSIGINKQGYIDANIKIVKHSTFYYRHFNYMIGFCLIMIAGLAFKRLTNKER